MKILHKTPETIRNNRFLTHIPFHRHPISYCLEMSYDKGVLKITDFKDYLRWLLIRDILTTEEYFKILEILEEE